MTDWKTIESAPRDGTRVLTWCKLHYSIPGLSRAESNWDVRILLFRQIPGAAAGAGDWWAPGELFAVTQFAHEATHWMPLPEPPK
jgi:hypothetical protein